MLGILNKAFFGGSMSQITSQPEQESSSTFSHFVGEGFLRCDEDKIGFGQNPEGYHPNLTGLDKETRPALEALFVAYVMAAGFVFDRFKSQTHVLGAGRDLVVNRDRVVLRSVDESPKDAAQGFHGNCRIALSPAAKRKGLIPLIGEMSMPLDVFLARLREDEENFDPRNPTFTQSVEMIVIDRYATLVHQYNEHPVLTRPLPPKPLSLTTVSQPA
jgi:hypothetical protein